MQGILRLRYGSICPSIQGLTSRRLLFILESALQERGRKMDILWLVNTNTFLLIILILMVSFLITQVNALIRFLRGE